MERGPEEGDVSSPADSEALQFDDDTLRGEERNALFFNFIIHCQEEKKNAFRYIEDLYLFTDTFCQSVRPNIIVTGGKPWSGVRDQHAANIFSFLEGKF